MRDVILSTKTYTHSNMGAIPYGLFGKGMHSLALFPTYNLDEEFLGATRITKRGLVLFSILDNECCVNTEGSCSVLRDYKLYTDIKSGTVLDSIPLSSYKFSRDVDPLFAVPCALDSTDDKVYVRELILYNLFNDKILYADLRTNEGQSTLEDALMFVGNIDYSGQDIVVRVSDEKFFIDEALGTMEEKALWNLSNPDAHLDGAYLRFNVKSADYRLICPAFKAGIVLSGDTGYDKLSIYNLPVYSTLKIEDSPADERSIHLYDSCRGSVEIVHNLMVLHTIDLDIISDGSLVDFNILNIDKCRLQLNSCYSLKIHDINSCIMRLRDTTKANISNTNFTSSEFHGASLHFLACCISNSSFSDITTCLDLSTCEASNVKFNNIFLVLCDSNDSLCNCEFRNIFYLRLALCEMKDCTLYADNTTLLELGNGMHDTPSGTIYAHLSSDTLNLCTNIPEWTDISNLISWLDMQITMLRKPEGGKKVSLVVKDCDSSEINIVHTVYFRDEFLAELAKTSHSYFSFAALLVVAIFTGTELVLPRGTTGSVKINLSSFSRNQVLNRKQNANSRLNELPSNMSVLHFDIRTLFKEAKRECLVAQSWSIFELWRVIKKYAIDVAKMFKKANINSIDVQIFT